MTFYTFMMRNYRNEDTPQGDLARDMHEDRDSFPKNGKGKFTGWHKIIRDYLEYNDACDKCLDAFEESWEEYVRCEKKR